MNELTGHLVISNYPNLKSIHVFENSLQNILSLKITNNPELQTITVDNYGCEYVLEVEFSSLTFSCLLIGSSSIHYIQNRMGIILVNNLIEFLEYLI